MKKLFIISLLIILSSSFSSQASDFNAANNEGDMIFYNITSSISPYTVEVTYNGSYSNFDSIIIPSSVTFNGINYSVTSIGDNAFRDCERLTYIIIPNSITSIGQSAFNSCKYLRSIIIPNSVTTIEDFAFFYCTALKDVYLSNSLNSISNYAFTSCRNLKSIIIPNSVTSIGSSAFSHCDAMISITIPNSVTWIGDYVFGYCTSLPSITLPDSIIYLGDEIFENCTSLSSIIMPNYLTSIGFNAFGYCISLKSINIPSYVTYIDHSAFSGCTGLTSITSNSANPAVLNDYIFNCPTNNITVFIPCGSMSSYQNANYWNSFTNFKEVNFTPFIQANICQGETYTENGFYADSTSVYNKIITSANGCDTLTQLNLIVYAAPFVPENLNVNLAHGFFAIGWYGKSLSYEIYRNDSLIATVNQSLYYDSNVVNSMNYCYKIRAINGNCKSDFSDIVCNRFIGLDDISNSSNKIILYPNPTNDKTTLEINNSSSNTDVNISDIYGRIIKTYKLNVNQNELEIDVNGFAKGIYIIDVIFNNGRNSIKSGLTKKLIVK